MVIEVCDGVPQFMSGIKIFFNAEHETVEKSFLLEGAGESLQRKLSLSSLPCSTPEGSCLSSVSAASQQASRDCQQSSQPSRSLSGSLSGGKTTSHKQQLPVGQEDRAEGICCHEAGSDAFLHFLS